MKLNASVNYTNKHNILKHVRIPIDLDYVDNEEALRDVVWDEINTIEHNTDFEIVKIQNIADFIREFNHSKNNENIIEGED